MPKKKFKLTAPKVPVIEKLITPVKAPQPTKSDVNPNGFTFDEPDSPGNFPRYSRSGSSLDRNDLSTLDDSPLFQLVELKRRKIPVNVFSYRHYPSFMAFINTIKQYLKHHQ